MLAGVAKEVMVSLKSLSLLLFHPLRGCRSLSLSFSSVLGAFRSLFYSSLLLHVYLFLSWHEGIRIYVLLHVHVEFVLIKTLRSGGTSLEMRNIADVQVTLGLGIPTVNV